jgi:hypothetical protein
MRRLLMVGRWVQVIGGVLAWLLLVPLLEAVRSVVGRASPRLAASMPPRRPPVKARPPILSEERGPAA